MEERQMNHKHKPDNNAMFESESPETHQQLDALEQRLRATRPQPPRLDVVALVREADTQTVERRASVVQRSLWIAGSWACGAVIGASVMFILMSGAPFEPERVKAVESPSPTTALEGHLPQAPPSTSPRLAKEEAGELSGSISMLALDLLDDSRSGYLADGGTLQVGMYLRRRARSEQHAFVRRNREGWRDVERKRLEPDSISKPHPAPSPPITQQKLMQELLEEPVGAVL